MKSFGLRFWVLAATLFVAAAFRLIPHPANFTPVMALALFGGAMIERRWLAPVLPLIAMIASDLVLGFHEYMIAVYGTMIVISLLGFVLRDNRTFGRVALTTVGGSLLFFFVTNFAVWYQGEGLDGGYAKTWAGLMECYAMGLPFLKNSLMGDALFSAILFGGWAMAERQVPQLRASGELAKGT